ncbi:MAG: phosphatase PAP2 family protein [Bacteroidales bacterium]
MFKTGIHHFLQDFAGSFSIWFMQTVSKMGTESFFMLALFIILFGFSFRKGFIVFQVLIWTTLLTNFLKTWFNLPRPMDIDAGLLDFGERYNRINLNFTGELQKIGFFDRLPEQVVNACRQAGIDSPGLPSGHVSSVTSFWLALSVLYKRSWLWILSLTLILLTIISRMFLGHHFLADVSGGLLLALLVLLLFPGLIMASSVRHWYLNSSSWLLQLKPFYLLQLAILFVLPLGISFLPGVGFELTSPLLGINLAVVLSSRRTVPSTPRKWYRRILSVLIALSIYLGLSFLFSQIPDTGNPVFSEVIRVLKYCMVFLLALAILRWVQNRFPEKG